MKVRFKFNENEIIYQMNVSFMPMRQVLQKNTILVKYPFWIHFFCVTLQIWTNLKRWKNYALPKNFKLKFFENIMSSVFHIMLARHDILGFWKLKLF